MGVLGSFAGQLSSLPYPKEDCTGRVIIVTGANIGLGLEAARHFVRLNATKVILGCRNLDGAEKAKSDIEETTKRTGVVQVWPLDLSSFDSVREFAARANKLERLDILLNNASVLNMKWEVYEGHEAQITVNVISTFLLSLLVLPTLRLTGAKFNIVPHLVTVSSDGAFLARFPQRKAENIMQALGDPKAYDVHDRYTTSKLLQLMALRKMAAAADASGKGHVIMNSLNPGLCNTQLFRNVPSVSGFPFWLVRCVVGRTPEKGSRTLMTAAFAGEETHGEWMTNCRMNELPSMMNGEAGEKLIDKVWGELVEIWEGIEPGVMKNL